MSLILEFECSLLVEAATTCSHEPLKWAYMFAEIKAAMERMGEVCVHTIKKCCNRDAHELA